MEPSNAAAGRHSTKATSIVTETESLLSKLGQGYKRAKAQQILRLLADQESLNQRFKDCALNDDEDEEDDEVDSGCAVSARDSSQSRRKSIGERSASPVGGVWVKRNLTAANNPPISVAQEGKDYPDGYLTGSSALVQAERKPKDGTKQKKKKMASAVDPSRCRTSMGFYNAAECSTAEDGQADLDVEGAANADLELAMGAEADSQNMSPRQALTYLREDEDFVITAVGARARLTPRGSYKQRRLFRQQMAQGMSTTVADTIPEESGIQSARSSRPKTGLVGNSARSRQYRRPAKPEPVPDESDDARLGSGRGYGQPEYAPTTLLSSVATTTTVSKLDPPPFTPRGSNSGMRSFENNPHTPRVSIRDDAIFIPITPRGGGSGATPRVEATYVASHRHNNEQISAVFTPRQTQPHDYNAVYTPRGGVSSGGFGAQDMSVPCNTPRQAGHDHTKAAYTPRQSVKISANGAYTPRMTGDIKSILSSRPSKNTSNATNENSLQSSRSKDPCSSPRRSDHIMVPTPRQKEHSGISLTARGNEASAGIFELSLSPGKSEFPMASPRTPKPGDEGINPGGALTPRSYNMCASHGQWSTRTGHTKGNTQITIAGASSTKTNLRQAKLLEHQSTFELSSPRNEFAESSWVKTGQNGMMNGDIGFSPRRLSDQDNHIAVDPQRSPRHVSRAVLSVEKNPLHPAATTSTHRHNHHSKVHNNSNNNNNSGGYDMEMTTPRRQRVVAAAAGSSVTEMSGSTAAPPTVVTPRGCGDLQRVGVHANLSQRPDRVHAMTVMKLPPLEATVHKPVVS